MTTIPISSTSTQQDIAQQRAEYERHLRLNDGNEMLALGALAYRAYAIAGAGQTEDFRPLPDWADLGDGIRDRWAATAEHVRSFVLGSVDGSRGYYVAEDTTATDAARSAAALSDPFRATTKVHPAAPADSADRWDGLVDTTKQHDGTTRTTGTTDEGTTDGEGNATRGRK